MGQDLLVFFYFFIGQQNLRQECLPTAKTWVDPGFVEPRYYKFGDGRLSLGENNTNYKYNWF